MAYLKQRVYREALVQLRTQAREGEVAEEDISLHLLSYLVDGPRVAEAQCSSSIVEGAICAVDGVEEGICSGGWEGDGYWWCQGRAVEASFFYQRRRHRGRRLGGKGGGGDTPTRASVGSVETRWRKVVSRRVVDVENARVLVLVLVVFLRMGATKND